MAAKFITVAESAKRNKSLDAKDSTVMPVCPNCWRAALRLRMDGSGALEMDAAEAGPEAFQMMTG
jgi:hypothetical protein